MLWGGRVRLHWSGDSDSVDVEDNSFASSNLLHALNSTTYLCFLDKEGLLTTSRRVPSEVCVPHCKSPPDFPLPEEHSRNETDIAILDLQAVDIPKASWLRKEPSEEVEDDATAFALRNDALNSRRVQLAEGLRFENNMELKKHIVQLRALGVATSRARLATNLPRRQAESSSNSSAFQTMWNVRQLLKPHAAICWPVIRGRNHQTTPSTSIPFRTIAIRERRRHRHSPKKTCASAQDD
ncbi:MAG: hypothetical protein KVP17_001147 [Porospora cf. gigantea B]|uniref:uncharacterized protein n=1 Tax=Porospora cf. gigantea B TaxID=2853592 RepID=UPI0035718FA9|nr:MAG: hypothetical protein KVP17_001147 [Porospora cf. gigantea B]